MESNFILHITFKITKIKLLSIEVPPRGFLVCYVVDWEVLQQSSFQVCYFGLLFLCLDWTEEAVFLIWALNMLNYFVDETVLGIFS